MTSPSGAMRESITLQQYTEIDDGAGNFIGDYADVTTVPARIRYLKGSEEVLASRLTGVQPVIVTIRNGGPASAVSTDWRVVNERAGLDAFDLPAETFNIRSIIKTERGDYIELLCEKGTA